MTKWLLIALFSVFWLLFASDSRFLLQSSNGDIFSMPVPMAALCGLALVLFFWGLKRVFKTMWQMRQWWNRPRYYATTNNVLLAEQALQKGRTRKALRLLKIDSKSNIHALKPLVRIHLQHRRADRALLALQEALLKAPHADHVMLFRKIRPLLHATTIQKFKDKLQQTAPDAPVVRRLLALEALLEGRCDAEVQNDIALQALPLSAALLQAAVRAKQQNNTDAMHLLIKAALPEQEARMHEDIATIVQSLVLNTPIYGTTSYEKLSY